MLRIAAEFENYKKRVRKEQSESESKARESVIRDMLEVVDNLERAVAAGEGTDPKALQQGVQLVLRLFGNKLERYDVKPFEAKGQPFDPRLHDAISQIPTADAPPGLGRERGSEGLQDRRSPAASGDGLGGSGPTAGAAARGHQRQRQRPRQRQAVSSV